MEAAKFGDQTAYDELVRRCYMPVLRYCCVMGSPQDADDLTQETFLRALKNSKLDASIRSVEGFMIYVAGKVCIDYIRQRAKARTLHLDLSNDLKHYPADNSSDQETSSINDYYLDSLNDDMKKAFVLTQIVGLSYGEVSELENVAIGTIRSRVARARLILKSSNRVLQLRNEIASN